MNDFFQLLESILRQAPDLSHNMAVTSVSAKGHLETFRPVLIEDKVKVKCNSEVLEFDELPGCLKVEIMDNVDKMVA
jgi:hypothetical protein